MKKGIIYIIILAFCCISQQLSAEMLLTPGDSTILYTGCSADGYAVDVNGTTYDEANPIGAETLVGASYSGADSIVTIDLTFNPGPSIGSIISGPVCEGEDAIIFTNADFGTYEWSDGQIGDQITLSGLSAGSYDYTLTITDPNGCQATASTTVVINPLPTPVIYITETSGIANDDGIICDGDPVVLDLDNAYSQYTWATGEITPTITVGSAGTYAVTVTDFNGCQGTAEATIIVNQQAYSEENYNGCSGDGYSVTVNGTVYDESNPTGTETIATGASCDSIVNINLDFSCQFPMTDGTFNVCSGVFTDTGGSGGDYQNSEEIITTLCSDNSGAIVVEFTSFETEMTFDFLYIYDGTDTNATLLGTYDDDNIPPTFTSSGTCLTFFFDSDGSVTKPGWEANISCGFGSDTNFGEVSYAGCVGDGYSIIVNGNNYDEANPIGTELLAGGSYDGQDSVIYVDLTFLAPSYSEELYMGCPGDGYSVTVNGTVYDEANPTGSETMTAISGCDSIVNISLTFGNIFTVEDYSGCSSDNYEININGTIYNEANPSGQEVFTSYLGCDSTVYIDLSYYSPNPTITITDDYGIADDDGIICPLGFVLFDAGTFASYEWSNGDANQYSSAYITGTYTVTVTDSDGCTATAETIVINNAAPTPTISIIETSAGTNDDGIICDGDAAILSVNETYASYDGWSTSETGSSITVSTAGSYTVSVTDVNGCQANASATISSVNIYSEETYTGCSGDGYNVTVNGTVYDESNPTGTETIATGASCDSIVTINLDFSCQFSMTDGTFNVCSGVFTDTGGYGGDYQNNEEITTTLCSDNSGAIVVEFTSFETEMTFDFLYIYDGTDTNATLLGTYDDDNIPPTFTSSGTCLTFFFDSDGSITKPGWEANISCQFGPGTTFGEDNYVGCAGDGYSIVLNGNDYDEFNTSGTELLVGGGYNGQDSVVYVNLTFNPTSTGTETYVGEEGDAYEVLVNGNTYNEANPSGIEILANQYGCDSTVTITLNYYPEATEFVNYEGCSGDGYSFDANGVIYNENNPIGTETMVGGSYVGTDSVIVVNLVFSAIDVTIQPSALELNCENQSIDLITNVTNPTGDVSYTWSDGETPADITVNFADTYTVTVTDDLGCTSEAEVTITEAAPSDCVFPGDANYDFVVNSQDHLTVCLAGGDTGPARQTQGIAFTAHDADDWNETVLSGTVDKKHLDCDGDGIIQWADLDAVNANYNSMHDGTNALRMEGAPSVRLVFEDQYNIDAQNNMITGNIIIDNIDTQEHIEELYGILFSIEYDNTFIEEGSIVITYQDSWLGSALEVAPLYKDFYDAEQMDLAFTRGNQASVSGSGIIATISFIIEDNLIGYTNDYDIPMNVTNIYAHNHMAEEQAFNGEATDVHISIISANENILSEESIDVYPNPTSGKLVVDMKGLNGESIALYNAIGQLVLQDNIQDQTTILDLDAMSKGIYFLNVKTEEGIVNVKIIVD